MEEKLQKNVEQRAAKKLSYEELENAARQIAAQLEAVAGENQQLRAVNKQLQMGNLYNELNLRFKVLEYEHFFEPEFIDACVSTIKEIMTPVEEETAEEDKK